MIDWAAKLIELKSMADEMDMWHAKTDGHLRAMLGRNADDLRAFIRQIEAEMIPSGRSVLDEPPAWVMDTSAPRPANDDPYDNQPGGGSTS